MYGPTGSVCLSAGAWVVLGHRTTMPGDPQTGHRCRGQGQGERKLRNYGLPTGLAGPRQPKGGPRPAGAQLAPPSHDRHGRQRQLSCTCTCTAALHASAALVVDIRQGRLVAAAEPAGPRAPAGRVQATLSAFCLFPAPTAPSPDRTALARAGHRRTAPRVSAPA